MYTYDVFISYKRGGSRDEWMRDLFYPWFKEKLEEAFANENFPSDPVIFFDQVKIDEGSNWKLAIQQAVQSSKVMVSICTPTYFRRSEWCVREFAAMYFRGKSLGFLTASKNKGLVTPLIKQQIENLPDSVQLLQFLDYSKFNQVGTAFKNTSEYLEFQKVVQGDAITLAKFIKEKVPAWRVDFDAGEWFSMPPEEILEKLNINEPKQNKPGWEK
jgi:hypothetical protein